MGEEKANGTKLIAAVTAMLVAAGGVLAALGGLFGGGDQAPAGITIILDSPAAFEAFISNHPSNG